MKIEGHICEATLNVVGYQRSGQHGVAGWIMANLPSPSVFLNNLGPMGADRLWYINGERVKSPPEENPKVVVCGLEGCYRRAKQSPHFSLFVVRDIKNHMASIIRHPRFSPSWPEFFRIWEEYANILMDGLPEDVLSYGYAVNFNSWFVNRHYRADLFYDILDWLEITADYADAGMNAMMASGGGSSFDFQKYEGRASQMAVLSRYKDVQLPFIPDHLLDLNQELFGDIYEDN